MPAEIMLWKLRMQNLSALFLLGRCNLFTITLIQSKNTYFKTIAKGLRAKREKNRYCSIFPAKILKRKGNGYDCDEKLVHWCALRGLLTGR